MLSKLNSRLKLDLINTAALAPMKHRTQQLTITVKQQQQQQQQQQKWEREKNIINIAYSYEFCGENVKKKSLSRQIKGYWTLLCYQWKEEAHTCPLVTKS